MQTMDDGYLVCENGRIAGVSPRFRRSMPRCRCWTIPASSPPRHDRSAWSTRRSSRSADSAMGLELLEWLNTYTFPEEAKYARSRIRRPRIFQLCGPSAPQHHDARGHLRHDPSARHAPADGKAGNFRPRHLRRQGQHEPQLSALSARAVNEPFPARHRTLDSRYQRTPSSARSPSSRRASSPPARTI